MILFFRTKWQFIFFYFFTDEIIVVEERNKKESNIFIVNFFFVYIFLINVLHNKNEKSDRNERWFLFSFSQKEKTTNKNCQWRCTWLLLCLANNNTKYIKWISTTLLRNFILWVKQNQHFFARTAGRKVRSGLVNVRAVMSGILL